MSEELKGRVCYYWTKAPKGVCRQRGAAWVGGPGGCDTGVVVVTHLWEVVVTQV